MNAGYCTPYVEKASKFNGFTHANQYSYGFIPCELPDRVKGAGETYGLRNANGDWIISLTAWWDHDPRAEQEYKKFILREAEALGRGRSSKAPGFGGTATSASRGRLPPRTRQP